MKYLILVCLMLVACTEPKDKPEMVKAYTEEQARYNAGPTKKPGCYKIVNKKSERYGCTFFSSQGSMFVGEKGGQHPGRREYEDGSAVTDPAKWMLVWNKRIRCLDDRGYFIDEADVKSIKCPESLYHD